MAAKNHRRKNQRGQNVQPEQSASLSSKELKVAYLANLPDNATILQIIRRSACDELIVQPARTDVQICPQCGGNDCII